MPTATTDLLLHPVRMRIIQAFLGGRALTAQDLGQRLGDVPPATLYRHLNALAHGGVLVVSDERKVRGAVEKRYALADDTPEISPAELAAMSPADLLRAFVSFLAGLIGAFARYLNRGRVDLARDGVGFREVTVQLSDEELRALLADLDRRLRAALTNEPRPDRQSRLFARIVLPGDPAPLDDSARSCWCSVSPPSGGSPERWHRLVLDEMKGWNG